MDRCAAILVLSFLCFKGIHGYPQSENNLVELMEMVDVNAYQQKEPLDQLVPLNEDGDDQEARMAMPPAATAPPTPAPTAAPVQTGSTYIRWGNSVCPDVDDTELVYSGITGGSYFYTRGGASNYLCMASQDNVEYSNELKYRSHKTHLGYSFVYGTEYEAPITGSHDHNVPCAVCETARSRSLMIPGTSSCPGGWTREYFGYIMSAHAYHYRTTFVCVDSAQTSLTASCKNTNGALFYHAKAAVNCPAGLGTPYNQIQDLNCVVCTK